MSIDFDSLIEIEHVSMAGLARMTEKASFNHGMKNAYCYPHIATIPYNQLPEDWEHNLRVYISIGENSEFILAGGYKSFKENEYHNRLTIINESCVIDAKYINDPDDKVTLYVEYNA